jgi:SprT protein
MKQLDFFSRLLSKVVPAPQPPKPVVAVKKPVGSEDSALTELCADLLRKLGYDTLAAQVRVRWNSRMQSTAGLAYPAKALIKLNPRLQAFGFAEVEQTLKHELAHLLAHHRAGRRRISPHGPEWRKACADLGINEENRCHTLPLPRREIVRRHLYQCPACGMAVHRVRPIRRPSACLPCCRKHNSGRYDERFRFVKVKQSGNSKAP